MKRTGRVGMAVAWLLPFVVLVPAPAAERSPYQSVGLHEVRYLTLDNGLRVLLKRRGEAPSVSLRVSVGVGNDHLPCRLREAPHFLEHLLFTGTATYDESLDVLGHIHGKSGTLEHLLDRLGYDERGGHPGALALYPQNVADYRQGGDDPARDAALAAERVRWWENHADGIPAWSVTTGRASPTCPASTPTSTGRISSWASRCTAGWARAATSTAWISASPAAPSSATVAPRVPLPAVGAARTA